jgi:hypothetical protein
MTEFRYSQNITIRSRYHQAKRLGITQPVVAAPATPLAWQFLLDGKAPPAPARELSAIDRRTQYHAKQREKYRGQ